MRVPALAAAALVLLVAGPASAVRIVILDLNDGAGRNSGERNRAAVVEALDRRTELELVPLARYLKTAKRKNVKARELDTPKGIARIAPAAGVDGILAMRLKRGGGGQILEAVVYDKAGLELWSRDIPFKGTVIPEKLSAKLAAAVVAAVASVQAGGKGDPEDGDDVAGSPEREPERRQGRDAEDDRGTATERDADPGDQGEASERVGRDTRDGDRRDSSDSRDSSGTRDGSDGGDERAERRTEDFNDEKAPPAEDFGDKQQLRFPLLEARAGVRLTWRSYSFDPVTGLEPVTYTTQTPYPGGLLDVAFYPLHASRNLALQGVGAQASFSWGRLTSKFKDPTGVEQSFESQDLRLTADLLYRYQFGVSPRAVVAGPRVGFDHHAFSVGTNPAIVSSVRSTPRAGADVFVPLVPPLFTARAGFSWLFAPSPGDEERAAYGEDAKGSGFRGELGIGNPLSSSGGVRYEVVFDFASFSDTYAGPPKGGGKAEESYYGFGALVGYAL